MFARYRLASRDWAFRLISIDEFRRSVLQLAYLCLASDAEEPFRQELIAKLKRLDEECPGGTSRRRAPRKASRSGKS